MQYLDSNVFIHAALNDQEEGNAARQIFSKLISRREQAVTSTLTLDEVAWKIKKHQGKMEMLNICRNFLANPAIRWVAATPEIMKKSLDLMEKLDLDPRDAIHAATCQIQGLDEMISDDSGFDRLKEMNIKRISLTKSD